MRNWHAVWIVFSCPVSGNEAVGPLVVDLKDIVSPDLGVCSRGQITSAYGGGMRTARDKVRQILSVVPRRLHSPIGWK